MKIAVLLSGGVDSSVALELLRRQGHELHAFYLKIWLEDELAHLGHCPWEEDLRYARAVCAAAGVPLEVVPLQRAYHERVVEHALAELAAGRTPSPDVFCNRRIKFGAFLDHLEGGSFDKVASGHYARVRPDGDGWQLLRGVDPVKDQTYFLYRLDQRRLARCLFPIGGLRKNDVRRLAHDAGLPTAGRKDSQGICFLGKIRYDDFVSGYLGERRGEIRDLETGRRLGEHRGYWFHTIGQRKGLGLGGGPWYVVDKDLDDNVVWVVHGERLEGHRRRRLRLADVHWIGGDPLAPTSSDRRLSVKLRHTPDAVRCRLIATAGDALEVRLDEPDAGIAAGQSAVLYDGELCLGGGTIVPFRPRGGTASSR